MQSRKGCRSWESWRRKMGCEEMRNPFLHSPSFFLFSFLHHYGQTAAQVLPEPLGHGLELLEFHRRSPGGGEGQDGTAVQDGRFDGLDGSGLGVIQTFCQGQEQGGVAQPFQVDFRDQFPVGPVPQVAPIHPMVPGGQDGGVYHIQVVQAEEFPVFDQIAAVPGVVVIVDGDADVMEQGGCFQEGFPADRIQFVEGLPAPEQLDGVPGHQPAVSSSGE